MEKIWFCIQKKLSEEDLGRLKALAPKGWKPPVEKRFKPQYDRKFESSEEIDKIMRQPPNYNKGGGRVRR